VHLSLQWQVKLTRRGSADRRDECEACQLQMFIGVGQPDFGIRYTLRERNLLKAIPYQQSKKYRSEDLAIYL